LNDQWVKIPTTLVVDLDGTLLRSDMLFESFWSALSQDWRSPILSARALLRGRAALKQHLASAAKVDVTTLPFDPGVVEHVRQWRAGGGRTALVTATDQALAERIAEHLGLFDEVHGSDGRRNLKGPAKAAFLAERFAGGYAYVGDAAADLPVWEQAQRAYTVNLPRRLRTRADRLGVEIEHMVTGTRSARPYLRAMRPHQWVKNALVFLPVLASHQITALTLLQSLLAFVAFSLVASSVYVLNDLLDLAADREHPRKRNRPFASGAIPIAHGTWMGGGLLLAGGLTSLTLGGEFLFVMLAYYVATLAYSLHLKRRALVDIALLAGLYTIRIVAGSAATGIQLSMWLLAFSIFLFFSLAAVKRQAELIDNSKSGKVDATGRGYLVSDLPIISAMAIASGYVAVLVMALYINSPAVRLLYSYVPVLWGICCVLLYWVSRMVMITHRGRMHDDPIVFAFRDRVSQVCLLTILLFATLGAAL
jgi:4-hydroxybenzoate polyprenyltransferase/phosphoserine phosphatase